MEGEDAAGVVVDRYHSHEDVCEQGIRVEQGNDAVGMLGWLAQSVRFDVSYAFSRIAQHSVSPTESAMKAVRTAFAYLKKTKHYCISACSSASSAQIYADDVDIVVDIVATLDKCSLQPEDWSFMVDFDHAGNAEVQNRRRSQIGLIIKLTGL